MALENLLLLHGALGSKEQLTEIQEHLSNRYQVYAIDFDGHGNNSSGADFSIDLFVSNVLDFLTQNNLNNTHIFGYSMGGYVALTLASKYPEQVKSIVTFGTKFNWTKESAIKETSMLNPELIETKAPKFAGHLKSVHGVNNWKTVLLKTSKMMMEIGANPPLTSEILNYISLPVLINIGDQDTMVSIDESRESSEQLNNGSLNVLKGFQHPVEKNDSSTLANVVDQFIASSF